MRDQAGGVAIPRAEALARRAQALVGPVADYLEELLRDLVWRTHRTPPGDRYGVHAFIDHNDRELRITGGNRGVVGAAMELLRSGDALEEILGAIAEDRGRITLTHDGDALMFKFQPAPTPGGPEGPIPVEDTVPRAPDDGDDLGDPAAVAGGAAPEAATATEAGTTADAG